MKLYEIDQHLEKLIESSVDKETGEINEEAEKELNNLGSDRDKKISNIAKLIRNEEADIVGFAEEIKKIKTLAKHFEALKKKKENKINWLKNYVSDSMKKNNEEEKNFEGIRLCFRCSEALIIEDDAIIPKEFLKVVESVDKANLKNFIKTNELKGVYLEKRENLQIK